MSQTIDNSRMFHKLKGRDNYHNWKIAAKSYLVIKKLWSYILKEPDVNKADEVEKDLTAWAELNLLLEENLYSYIASTTTAKAAWDALEKSFEDTGLCRKVELLKQMVRLSLNGCDSIEDYVDKMVTISLKVQKAGLKIDEEIVASFMLAGLPDEFNPLVMAVENSSKVLTVDLVKTTLLQETRFQKQPETVESEAFTVKANRSQNSFRCHFCGELGHFARFCPKKSGELCLASNIGTAKTHNSIGTDLRSTNMRRGDPF